MPVVQVRGHVVQSLSSTHTRTTDCSTWTNRLVVGNESKTCKRDWRRLAGVLAPPVRSAAAGLDSSRNFLVGR